MFYTRIPCPKWIDHKEEYLNEATRYFPLIGYLIGLATAIVVYLALFIFPPPIAVILSMLTSILMTGAFHEDGFADVCDGFGGGWTKEKILEIMKDSRVGTYALVGLGLLLSLKMFTLIALVEINLLFCAKSMLFSHIISRFSAIMLMFTHHYSRDDQTSKVKPIAKKLSTKNFLYSAIWLIPACFLFQSPIILLVFIPIYLLKAYLGSYFTKWIGGYTGDCLGATQQLSEICTLLFCLAWANFK
jgi:adenosylcobinamide-GDP ribazoletransferase